MENLNQNNHQNQLKQTNMDKELKEKLEKLKVDAPVKKKKCTECKKKKQPVTKLPDLIEDLYIPTKEDVMLAYIELGNKGNDKHQFINKVYSSIFNENFDFGCEGCVNRQGRKFKNYIETTYQIKL